MEILPNEVESVKVIGNLHGDEVKVVKTFGGFYIAVGKKNKTARKSEALAAGSHQALVSHQLCKEFGSDFEPAIFKSEHDQLAKVETKTEYLSSDMIAKGVELFTLTKGSKIDFVLVKHGLTLGEYSGEIKDKSIVLYKGGFTNKEAISSNFKTARAMSRAIKDKVHELKLNGVKKGY
jgi:hypothetical protein